MVKILLVLILSFNIVKAVEIKDIISYHLNQYTYEDLVKKIKNKKIRKVLSKPWLRRYLSTYYRPSMYTIFKHESGNFRYKVGLKDKNDIGYCQINKTYWPMSKIKKEFKLSRPFYSWNQFKHDIPLQVEVCSLIWLYNIGIYIISTGKEPTNMLDYITLYHSFKTKYRLKYRRKIRKVFYICISKSK